VSSDADSGKKRASEAANRSASGPPLYAVPVCYCLRFVPDRRRTHFYVQIVDLGTGQVLEESPRRQLAELPVVLGKMSSWVRSR
jgi:hypothetical protein